MTQAPAHPDLATLCASLATALGLPPDTAPDAILARLRSVTAPPDPAKYMPMAAVQEMLRDRRTELVATDACRVTQKVEPALNEHYITNGMKGWATALCQSDDAAFDTFCESSCPMFACLFTPIGRGASHSLLHEPSAPTALEAAICEQLRLKPGPSRLKSGQVSDVSVRKWLNGVAG